MCVMRDVGRRRTSAGQAILEFIVMFALFLGVLAMMALFLHTFQLFGGRVLDLVASEYP